MPKLRSLSALLVLVSSVAFAGKPIPLPESVYKAKTIFIVNHTNDQNTMDAARAEFTTWGRYKIVETKDAADLVAVFDPFNIDVKGNTHTLVKLSVFVPGNEEPAFVDAPVPALDFHKNGARAKSCVEHFEKRMGDDPSN